MKSLQLSSYPRPLLESTLKILKSYRNSLKQVGKRAKIVDTEIDLPKEYVIEYASGMTEKDARISWEKALRSFFPSVTLGELSLRENTLLTWGIRIFYGDDMVDISFQKIQTLLQK